MEILSQVKTLNFFKRFLLGETDGILPFDAIPQKGPCPVYNGQSMPRSSPEALGVKSSDIQGFLQHINSHPNAGVHSVIFARKGKIICEAGFAPYSTKRWHVTHSMCKSVTGTAVGMLCDEGLLKLSEKICDIFPEKCTLLTSRRTRQITVEHLLTMGSGVMFKELGAVIEADWVKAFLEADVSFEPGTKFDYNSMNSYMLSAIISKKTGMTLNNYLRTRLFEPLGFGPVAWESCPLGITKGGWGMYVFLEDLVKLGQLYMQNGVWNDKQIISKEWAQKAVSSIKLRDTGEEYGYHIWANSKNNGFMFNGMFGQYVAVFPDKELIIAVNSGNGHLFTQSFVYSLMCDFCEGVNTNASIDVIHSDKEQLSEYIENLYATKGVYDLPKEHISWYQKLFAKKQAPAQLPQAAAAVSGKSFSFKKNNSGLLPIILQCVGNSFAKGLNSIALDSSGDKLYLVWNEGDGSVRIPLCFTSPAFGQINLNGEILDIGTTAIFKKDEDDNIVLKISVAFIESSSTRLIKIFFEDGAISVKLDESPAIALAMEKIHEEHIALKNIDPAFFKDIDFVEYQFNRICAPTLKGIQI